MVFGIGSTRHGGVGPRHPRTRGGSGIVKHGTLGQEVIVTPQGVFHRPLHAEPQFPFSAGDIRPLWRSIDGVEYRVVLRGRMGNGEAHYAIDRTPQRAYV